MIRYNDHELILASDNYQNYLIIRDRAGVCIIVDADLSEDCIDDIKYEFENDLLTLDQCNWDGLPFTDLSTFNDWKIIA